MHPSALLSPLALLLAPLALASTLQINLPSNLPPLPPSTHAALSAANAPLLTTPITTRNGFVFRNLTAGNYDLDIACREYDFEKGISVSVGEGGDIGVWRNGAAIVESGGGGDADIKHGEYKSAGKVEFEIRVVRRREWREERGGFSPLSLLQNPMILIAIVGLAVVIGMPYLLDNMDPEMRAEFEEQQKKSILSGGASATNPLQNFDMAAWMAGKTGGSGGGEKEAVEEKEKKGGGGGGGGGARKRRG